MYYEVYFFIGTIGLLIVLFATVSIMSLYDIKRGDIHGNIEKELVARQILYQEFIKMIKIGATITTICLILGLTT